jgi:hypothetical protein
MQEINRRCSRGAAQRRARASEAGSGSGEQNGRAQVSMPTRHASHTHEGLAALTARAYGCRSPWMQEINRRCSRGAAQRRTRAPEDGSGSGEQGRPRLASTSRRVPTGVWAWRHRSLTAPGCRRRSSSMRRVDRALRPRSGLHLVPTRVGVVDRSARLENASDASAVRISDVSGPSRNRLCDEESC